MTGILLAAALVPLLVLLYFLRLKRKPQPMASTLLWKKAVEDLAANAPFQRLRRNILLFLQLLALLLLALALMQPQVRWGEHPGGRLVMLIDNSGSMTATDVEDSTRLEEAKRLARLRVEEMYSGGLFSASPGETMIIAFNERAEVMTPFTDSRRRLLEAIDRIEPTHSRTSLVEALELARAFTTDTNPEGNRPIAEPPALELFSDGAIHDIDDIALRGESMRFFPIGAADPEQPPDNVAIASLSVDRPFDRPTSVQLFASILNFNQTPIATDLQLSIDNRVGLGGIESVDVPAATIDASTGALLPGRRNVNFTPFEQPRGAVIELAILRDDNLAPDNTAFLVVPPPRQLRVALVAPKSFVIRTVLEGLPLADLQIMTGDEFDAMVDPAASQAARLDAFDVVVLDSHSPTSLPPGRYLALGALPPIDGLNPYGEGDTSIILNWRQDHPALRYVGLDRVLVSRHQPIQPERTIRVLIEGSASPLLVEVDRQRRHVLYLAFDPLDSNWPLLQSFVTFMYNALDYLGHANDSLTTRIYQPGDAITAELPGTARQIAIQTPDGRSEPLDPVNPSSMSWGPVRLAGLHALTWEADDDQHEQIYAANMQSELESDLTVRSDFRIGVTDVVGEETRGSAYTALWPWAIGVALAILMIEWWIYHRKAFI